MRTMEEQLPTGDSPLQQKKKRGRPAKNAALAQNQLPPLAAIGLNTHPVPPIVLKPAESRPPLQTNPTPIVQATSFPNSEHKPKPTRKRQKLKLTAFDKDAFKLLRRGEKTVQSIAMRLGVSLQAAQARIEQLLDAGLATQNHAGELGLSIDGYNAFLPDSLETSLEERQTKREQARQRKTAKDTVKPPVTPTQETQEKATPQPPQKPLAATPATPTPPAEQAPILNDTPHYGIIEIEGRPAHERIDLEALLAKGAPKPLQSRQANQTFKQSQQRFKPHSQTEQFAEPSSEAKQNEKARQPKQSEKDENCVLCKSAFIISLQGGNPKYGHCFCGAAYHQDCYEGVLEAGGGCIQCGKQLDIILDRASLEEVRKIKDAFA